MPYRIMGRPRQSPSKVLTRKEKEEKKVLEAEADAILDRLFENPSGDNRKEIERLGWIEKRLLDIEGEEPLDVNSDFGL